MAVAPVESGDPAQVGRYRIVGRLGRGGMGRVYLGVSPGGRAVAVKVVHAELAGDAGFRRRFVREVAAARLVAGTFTAAVLDADPEGDPPWLATVYVPGMSLDAAVAAHGPWPERSVRALGAALAEGLESVHAAGVVHRDLKPSNVLLAADGPRLIDFGISLAAGNTQLTETGMVIGTPGYIPPEQLRHGESSEAGDVFALGAVLAYAATGEGPFGSGAAHALHYRIVHEAPDLTGLPSGLADVVARCLAKKPGERPEVPDLVAELGGDGAGGDGPPAPVVAEIARLRDAPLPESVEKSAVEGATVERTAVDTGPSGGRRSIPRGRVLAGVAATAALSLAAGGAVLAVGWSGGGGAAASGPPAWKELWSFPMEDGLERVAAAERTVYLGNDAGALYALDADSGAERWRTRHPGRDPRLREGTDEIAYYGDGTHRYALDARTGEQLWKIEAFGVQTPMTADGITYRYGDDRLDAIEPRTGELVWTKVTEGALWSRPAAAGGVVYLSDGDAVMHAVDGSNGNDLWTFDAGTRIQTSPAAADGTVYFGGVDGTLYAVDADSGREVWRHGFDGAEWDPAIAEGAGTPIVADGTVYFENDGYVCAFDAGTGRPLWTHEPDLEGEAALLDVRDGTVLFRDGVDDDEGGVETVYALDARTGDLLWDDALGENTTIAGDVLYYEGGGRLHAVSAAS